MAGVRVELEHFVPHPPERVFAVLSDPARRPDWQENTSDVEILDGGPVGVGTRWRETQRGVGRVEAEVVGLDPPSRWVEAGETHAGGGRIAVGLEPADGGGATRLTMTVELRLHGARRLMGPALEPMVRRQMPRDLDRLSALLDDEAASRP